MHKTEKGRELRNKSSVCRLCSLNFVDKSLREVLDFLQHIFYVCHFLFAFYHEIWIYVFEILKKKTHQNLEF